jgi:hypothetical protein
MAAKIREASDIAQPHLVLFEHLRPAHPQLIYLQFTDAQSTYGGVADPQPPNRQGTNCDCAHGHGSGCGYDDSHECHRGRTG